MNVPATRFATLTLALVLIVPLALAHAPAAPQLHCADLRVHDYVAAQDDLASAALPIVTPGMACAETSDPTFGIGGAFLPADHHGEEVCVADDVYMDVAFHIGRDGDGDGAITPTVAAADAMAGPFTRCATAPFSPGADGGWWILVSQPAIGGHILA